MNSNVRLKFTKIVVIASIIMSLGSVITTKVGLGEIYPFFFWKLYSQPWGWENKIEEYRIYARNTPNTSYHRLQIKATFTFPIDDYFYTFNRNINDYLKDKNALSLKRLQAFVIHVEPEYKYYKIVKETYSPRALNTKGIPYDTSTIISF